MDSQHFFTQNNLFKIIDMPTPKPTSLTLSILLLCGVMACHSRKSTTPSLADINLLRGDIALCGGSEFGEVNFALSCDPATQESFDLAVSLLHSFEHVEAEKAFVQVLDMDPDCAMAYWGIAMSKIRHPKWAPSLHDFEEGRKILELAATVDQTDREKEYIKAVAAYYDYKEEYHSGDHEIRSKKMAEKTGEIYERYPDDREAAILYAMTLFTTADPEDKTYADQRRAGKILESIYPNQPNHPGIAHYIIHNYDNPVLAHLGLNSAREYAKIAPASAHAQHMPSHIFTRLGLWDESISSNINSASAAVCYAEATQMEGHWAEEIHAMDYLVYAYLQKGDNENANAQLSYLQSMKLLEETSGYNFMAIPVRVVLENKLWSEAAALEFQETNFDIDGHPWPKALVHFARSLGAARSGNPEMAENDLTVLETLEQQLLTDKNDPYKANQVAIQIKASQAWIEYAKGSSSEALALMKEAADMENSTEKHPVTPGEVLPARELLGDLLMELNKPGDALVAYERSLELSPNRFNGVYGAASAAKALGDRDKAATYFQQLLELSEGVDSDRVEVQEARAFVGAI